MTAMSAVPVKKAPALYLVEFGVCMTLYVAAILLREWLYDPNASRTLRVAVIAMPVVPVWLAFLAVVRHYRRIDELSKVILLKNIAVAAGFMACLVTSYALLVDAGLPTLSITWAWPTLAACWAATTAINEWRAR